MISKSPFRQDKCAVAWEKKKKEYEAKGPGGLKEYNREKGEFYCDNGTIKLRPTDDADRPLSDAEIKATKEKKSGFGAKEKSIVEK
jgi:hypothetical protein